MATLAAPRRSARVNSRPAISGIPIARKYPALISLYRDPSSVSASFLNPSTETSLPQLSPASAGTSDTATEVTPGVAFSRSSRRSNSTRDREGHQVVDLQAQVHAAHVHQAAREQPRADEQRHRERDLRCCEAGTEA